MDTVWEALSSSRMLFAAGVLLALLAWETASPYFAFFRGKHRKRGQHAGRNLALGLLNGVITATIFTAAWASVSVWAEAYGFGLLNVLGGPIGLSVVIAVLALDFWTYWWHRWNHAIPFLWRFHRVHHSDSQMDVTTANRFHVGEIALSSLLRIPLIAVLGISLEQLALYEVLMFACVQFHHANIGLPPSLDRVFRVVFTSPNMHKVHHSRWQPETDSNFTSLFSIWDRLFGTFRLRKDPHEIAFGLDETDAPEHQSLPGLLRMPTEDLRPPKADEQSEKKSGIRS